MRLGVTFSNLKILLKPEVVPKVLCGRALNLPGCKTMEGFRIGPETGEGATPPTPVLSGRFAPPSFPLD